MASDVPREWLRPKRNGRAARAERNGTPGEATVQRWPLLGEDAYQGLPGHIVREIEPHTEADPVAVLVSSPGWGPPADGERSSGLAPIDITQRSTLLSLERPQKVARG